MSPSAVAASPAQAAVWGRFCFHSGSDCYSTIEGPLDVTPRSTAIVSRFSDQPAVGAVEPACACRWRSRCCGDLHNASGGSVGGDIVAALLASVNEPCTRVRGKLFTFLVVREEKHMALLLKPSAAGAAAAAGRTMEKTAVTAVQGAFSRCHKQDSKLWQKNAPTAVRLQKPSSQWLVLSCCWRSLLFHRFSKSILQVDSLNSCCLEMEAVGSLFDGLLNESIITFFLLFRKLTQLI